MTESDILMIELACRRLCVDYVRRMDARDSRCADLFAADGHLVLHADDLRGSAQIRGFVDRLPIDVSTLHLCGNVRVNVVDDIEARGGSDLIYFQGRSVDGVARKSPLAPLAIGAYEDIYRRTASGWRIASRRFTATFLAEPAKPRPR